MKRVLNVENPISVGRQPVQAEIRGFVSEISELQDLTRGNRVRDSFHHIIVDFYQLNKVNHRRIIGRAKIYIPTKAMGLRDLNSSIFYYPSPNFEDKTNFFQTAKASIQDLLNQRVGIIGMLSDDARFPPYTHFMNRCTKVVIFPPKEELK